MRDIFGSNIKSDTNPVKGFKFVAVLLGLAFLMLGCGRQSIDAINITAVNPPAPEVPGPVLQLFNVDLQGTTETAPTSATRAMLEHSLGGTNIRTESTSVSFRLTGGVGID